MRAIACALLALSAALAAPPPDPKALEIAHAMMQAMGGQKAWQQARYVRFDFIAAVHGEELMRRGHLWDTRTGRSRLEDKTAFGEPAVVLFNAATRQGVVYAAGKKLEGPAAAKALDGAYHALIYDTYWLAMPWKWLDPGVHLKYLGQKKLGAKLYDVVELTFDHVGPTPGDRYTAYVSPRSHLMEHWDYVLQSGQKGSWDWQYTAAHGIKLARDHTDSKGKSIGMGDVRVLDTVDNAFFTDPDHNLAQLPK
jgi:hypothetical protein